MAFRFTYNKHIPGEDDHDHETGWYDIGGWEFPANDDPPEWFVSTYERFSDVAHEAQFLGIVEDQGRWFSSVDPDVDYETGEETWYSLHVDGITPASYQRIGRYLRGDPIFPRSD